MEPGELPEIGRLTNFLVQANELDSQLKESGFAGVDGARMVRAGHQESKVVETGFRKSDKCKFCYDFSEMARPYVCQRCYRMAIEMLEAEGWRQVGEAKDNVPTLGHDIETDK